MALGFSLPLQDSSVGTIWGTVKKRTKSAPGEMWQIMEEQLK